MPTTTFASKLDEALITAPWSMDRIVDMLAQEGLQVSQATLSHWRTGRSAPKRSNSFRIITALEKLLDLPAKSLSSLVTTETKADSAPTSGDEPQPIEFRYDFLFGESQKETNWSADVQRELLEEETIFSADFMSYTHTHTFLVRIPQVEKPCMHFTVGLDTPYVIPETGYVELFNVKGATVAQQEVYSNGRTTVTRLDFPSSCYPGQLHRVSFSYFNESTVPFNRSLIQTFAWPFEFYVNRVNFEGKVPEKIEWVEEIIREKGDTTQTSISTRPIVPIENTIQICMEKPRITRGYFRWE